jgi:hypothetical protein
MPKFLLLAVEDGQRFSDVSPAEMQAIIERYVAWTEEMRAAGQLLDSNKLQGGAGRRVARRGKEIVVRDGPFSETKEVIGGYWIVDAQNDEAVVALAKKSPHLDFGTLEIRQIEEL